jgi:23S rRNA (uracil1939-C5)-methyltransferase
MTAGDRVALTIEKPVAGGRMLARLDGAVVLVSGAIPGEVVEAEIEKIQRGTIWARTARIVERVADRVDAEDTACGGNVLAHVRYERQLELKQDIIRDAFARIARAPLAGGLQIERSRPDGYRMRARLHHVQGRFGFFREGTHEWCDPARTGQLLPETLDALRALEATLDSSRSAAVVVDVEVAENRPASQRAFHLLLHDDSDPARLGALRAISGAAGVSCSRLRGGRPRTLWGTPEVTDTIALPRESGEYTVSLTRHAHAFFQGNRYVLPALVAAVTGMVPSGRVLDLYAGVGLFSVALAARGDTEVIAVEGDRTAAADLRFNASRAGGAIETRHQAVEAFLAAHRVPSLDTVIVDPPRTGLTKEALQAAIALRAPRLIYVSCDVATLGRDARVLLDAGYRLGDVRAFDLFPNTAHIETVARFER